MLGSLPHPNRIPAKVLWAHVFGPVGKFSGAHFETLLRLIRGEVAEYELLEISMLEYQKTSKRRKSQRI